MPTPTTTRPFTTRAITVILAAVTIAGCRSTPSTHGKDSIPATYVSGTLTTVISGAITTEQVMAAADQTFRDRGYSIVSSASTSDVGKIVAVPPRETYSPRVTFVGRATPDGVRVDISVEPWGSRELTGNLLDGVLRRLGR